ncbi:MAG: MmcQ/YjbR family DNA-binding protein [bacterium]|nr:MmcQ/YjbR family DNA-binding protein [bacterium]
MITVDDILKYVKGRYNTVPEELWQNPRHYIVLRKNESQKWYAFIGYVNGTKIGLNSDEEILILNVKAEPDFINFILSEDGFYPAYHMDKKNWVSVALDGTVDDKKIFKMIDNSYDLT